MINDFKEKLSRNGVVNIPGVIDPELISRAILATNRAIEQVPEEDVLRDANGKVRKLCYAFDKGDVFLDILSHPRIIHILKRLYGSDVGMIVPTWEDVLIKEPDGGVRVGIHQDLGLQSVTRGDVFSLAIHFHDCTDNPVFFYEGSHQLGPLTREDIQNCLDKNLYVPYPSKAGDVDIHNVLTLHYSEMNKSYYPRYTWYLEFRTMDQILADSPWDERWALSRQVILFHAIEERKRMGMDYEEIDFARASHLAEYIKNLNLRVPHVSSTVSYSDNEYNHFADHDTLF